MATSTRHLKRVLFARLSHLPIRPSNARQTHNPTSPHPSAALLIAAAAATTAAALITPSLAHADVATTTNSPLYSSPPPPSPPIFPLSSESKKTTTHANISSFNALLRSVEQADPSAVQALGILVNDADNHASLFSAGVVGSVTKGLRSLSVVEDGAAAPLMVNLVRVLADLAKGHEACSYFQADGASGLEVLGVLLKKFPPKFGASAGWGNWFWGWFGYEGSGEVKIEEARKLNSGEEGGMGSSQNVVDYLAGELNLDDVPSVDLGAGIAYHSIRCVANLARNSASHRDLIEAKLLPVLVSVLKDASVENLGNGRDEQLAEVVRCCVLAVAALGKSAAKEVVSLGGHIRLIYFMSQEEDAVAQMYAAGGVRNLARHSVGGDWRVHRELIVGGVAEGLKMGMGKDSSAQTKVFSVLAFGDLMTTKHSKAELIRKRLEGVFEVFSEMVKEKNAGVARAVHRSLMALYGEGLGDGGGEVVATKTLGELLGNGSGQLVNGAVARGDVAGLKAVRAMCKDGDVAQLMVDQGLLEVLVRGVNKGKSEYWEESIAALGELSNLSEVVPLIVSRGALRAVLKRPCLENDARWTAKFFANMARKEDHHVEIAHGGMSVLLAALLSKNDATKRDGARGLYNLSLGGVSRVMIGQAGALMPLVKTASTSGDARGFAIGALAKISEAYEHGTRLIEADFLSILLTAVKDDPNVAKDVAHCISNLSQNVDVHGSLASSGAAAWLVEMLSKNGGRGEHASEVLHYASLGVCNLAFSAGVTRTVLREAGAVSVLTALSTSGMMPPYVIYSARQALHNLKGSEKPGMLPIEPLPKPSLPA